MPIHWPPPGTLREHSLPMGQVRVCDQPALIRCRGLGSCVGLFLHDRLRGTGGGAHIVLPGNWGLPEESGEWLSAESALGELVGQLATLGSPAAGLRAKLVGGANLFGSVGNIGEQNVRRTKKLLQQAGIYLAAEAVGGQAGRSVTFHTSSGQLYLRSATGAGQVI
ncbi:MAG: chemotaxis protein CheD [Ferruginibacter sp.]|nr:chemotaxis protein CheD [Cytophagales bacterium]